MAFAAVNSLKQTIHRLKNPQITKSAHDELESLLSALRRLDACSNTNIDRAAINELDAQIRKAASKLQDAVDSYAFHLSLPTFSGSHDHLPQIPAVDDNGVEEETHLFLTAVQRLREEYTAKLKNPLAEEDEDDAVSPLTDHPGRKKSTPVGLSDRLDQIVNELIDLQPKLKIVSLFGMAGIGKTRLATEVYQHPNVNQEFDLRVWTRIGPNFQIKKVLVDVASQINGKPRNSYIQQDRKTLSELVYKSLSGQRFFIVLDDVWSTGAWDEMKRWFPLEENGSRILLTSRLEEVAEYPTTTSNSHKLPFLNDEESWNLLWRNVFDEMSFPPHLEKAGRKIAEICEGLPLLILAVAEILRGVEDKSEEYWNEVANKKTNTFPYAYDSISEQLLLSYEYLPQYLKACFLYIGVFPQNSEIHVTKLVNLWIVEDFLDSNEFESFEGLAVECLEKLVSQSLVIVCSRSIGDGIKSSKLHSAYWHLCVKEAGKNKLFHVLSKLGDGSEGNMESHHRLSVQNNILFAIKEVHGSMAATSRARSLLCTGEEHDYEVPLCLNLVLLQVLDALAIRLYEFPTEVLKLLQLRYLSLTYNGKLPPSVSKLRKLERLIIRKHHNIKILRGSKSGDQEQNNIKFLRESTSLPNEIWDLQELRHLRIMGSNLPDPTKGAELRNLLAFHADAHSCTEKVFRSIPKLKRLGVKIELQPDGAETLNCFEHIGLLSELESLKCVVVNPRFKTQVVAPPHHLANLPQHLKKLSLNGLAYSWDYMSVIGSLPNLQVLKLQCCAFQGSEWETKAKEFPSLEFLLLEQVDLVHWTTDGDDWLPCLKRLIVRHCYKLAKIPLELGVIQVLETIEVVDCSPLVVASTHNILKEGEEFGNFYLRVVISSSWEL